MKTPHDAQYSTALTLRQGDDLEVGEAVPPARPADSVPTLTQARKEGPPFRIALLDHHVPALHGLDLGLQIRAEADRKELRLAVLTSSGVTGDAERFRRAGFDAYLNKPYLRDTLVKVLQG